MTSDVVRDAERLGHRDVVADDLVVDPVGLDRRRRSVQIGLGVVWLIDAALQCQPYMFTKAFVNSALEPTAAGNPWVLARSIIWADHVMVHDIAWWNVLYATLQLLIALGLFWRPTVRWALGVSIVWGVGVWWFAEGFGGVFSGSSPLSGEPGAVILYVMLAILVWPPHRRREGRSVAECAWWGRRASNALWVLLWGNFAGYFLIPLNRSPQGPRDLVAAMTSGEPAWIRSLDTIVAGALNGRGFELSVALASACVAIALGLFSTPLRRGALVAALAFSVVVWMVQDFGGVLTSRGTDVNSGPLIALLVIAYWPPISRRDRDRDEVVAVGVPGQAS